MGYRCACSWVQYRAVEPRLNTTSPELCPAAEPSGVAEDKALQSVESSRRTDRRTIRPASTRGEPASDGRGSAEAFGGAAKERTTGDGAEHVAREWDVDGRGALMCRRPRSRIPDLVEESGQRGELERIRRGPMGPVSITHNPAEVF